MANTKPLASQVKYGGGNNTVDKTLKKAILSFPTLVEAQSAAATLPDGQIVEIEADETHDGHHTWYEVQGRALVYRRKQEYFNVDEFATIQAAVNHVASVLGVLRASGTYPLNEMLVIPSAAGSYTLDFSGAKFVVAPGVTRAIEIGTRGSNPWRGILRQPTLEKDVFEGGDEGLAIINAVEYEIDSPRVNRISKPMVWAPESNCRVTSGTINNPTLQNHEYAIYAAPTGGGYANDNTVNVGRFPMNVGGRLIDQVYLDNSDGTGVQHNRFIGINMEGWSGGGACGRTAVRCVNGANQNVFLFNRSEQYGTGWSTGAAFYFDSSTTGNYVEDTRIDTRVIDDSGFNEWDLPLMGRKKVSHSTAAAGSPAFKYVRQMPVPATNTPYAIDIEDTFSASGNAAFLKYKSARGGGYVIDMETPLGKVLQLGSNGEAATPYKRGGATTGIIAYGFRVEASITGATEVHGYSSNLAAATGVWNFYAGGSAPNYFGGKIYTVGALGVTPATSFTGFLGFSNTSSNTGAVSAEYTTNNVSARHHVSFSNPNGVVGSISTNASATLFNTSSDERLKTDILDADDSGATIDALKVRQFNWKIDGRHQDYGFIAQELYEVYPDAVSASDDPDAMWSIDYSKLVPLMLKEIQSLRNRLIVLEDANK